MPTIQNYDPLSAASDAVGAYTQQKRATEQTNYDRAAEQAAIDYKQKRDARTDMESDRSFADAHATTQSELESAAQTRRINQATEEYNAKLRPIELAAKTLDNQFKTGQITDQQRQAKLNEIRIQHDSLEQNLYKKYGPTIAKQAVDKGVADIAATQASTAASQASTALTRAEIPYVGVKATGGGRAAKPPSSIEQKEAALNARENLPPALRSILDQVESGQTTREAALTYINGNPQFKPYLPLIEQIMLTPTIVKNASQGQIKQTDADNAQARGDADGMTPQQRVTRAMDATKTFPAKAQMAILGMARKGVSSQAILQMIDDPASGASDEQKAAAHAVLDAAPGDTPAAAPQQSGGGFDLMGMLSRGAQAVLGSGVQNVGAPTGNMWMK